MILTERPILMLQIRRCDDGCGSDVWVCEGGGGDEGTRVLLEVIVEEEVEFRVVGIVLGEEEMGGVCWCWYKRNGGAAMWWGEEGMEGPGGRGSGGEGE
jgi:hypothetical protein